MEFSPETALNIFTLAVTIVGGLGTILAFWEKYVHQKMVARRERLENERSEKLNTTIVNTIAPLAEERKADRQDIDKLLEFAEKSLELHHERDKTISLISNDIKDIGVKVEGHDRRIWELEKIKDKGGFKQYIYKERSEEEN